MRRRLATTVLMLMTALILALPVQAQEKPFTKEQVQSMVRDGLGDETGAKAIEQRGIDFAPAEDFMQSLRAAGASEAFLKALRAADLVRFLRAEKVSSDHEASRDGRLALTSIREGRETLAGIFALANKAAEAYSGGDGNRLVSEVIDLGASKS